MKLWLCIPLFALLLSCRAGRLSSSSSTGYEAKTDFILFVQLINEGSNYSQVLNTAFKYADAVEVVDNFQNNPYIGITVIKIVFKDTENNRVADLKTELQKHPFIIEVSEMNM